MNAPSPRSPAGGRHILHLASGDRWAGAEAQLHTLLSTLQRQGEWEVEAVLLNDLEPARRLRQSGIAVTVLPEEELSFAGLLRALLDQVRQRPPALIHTHRQKENLLGALVARRHGLPSLRTVHGASEHPPRGLAQLHRRALRSLDRWLGCHLQQRVIAVSEPLRQQLEGSFPRSRLVTIPNGVDLDAVRRSATPPAALGPGRHIGLAGRLDPVKRVDLFLDMAALLTAEQDRDWHFHVFGGGALAPALQDRARELGLEDRLTFHGHRQDITACLAALDALVLCSDHEGLPMTVLEALAVGTPVLAHAVGGLTAVLEGGHGGLLVQDHSARGYAEGLQQLLALDRHALIHAGQQRLERSYSATANAAAVSALYRQLLSPLVTAG